MTIRFGDILLISLDTQHLEMVRGWRNAPHVVANMAFNTYITEEAQVKWYQSIDLTKNAYFVIESARQHFGLIHLAEIDYQKATADSGLFIGSPDALGTPIPIIASIALLELAFGPLQLRQVFAKVATHNKKAIDYNQWLGFRYLAPITTGFDRYLITSEYFQKTHFRLKSGLKLKDKKLVITLKSDHPADQQIGKHLSPGPPWELLWV